MNKTPIAKKIVVAVKDVTLRNMLWVAVVSAVAAGIMSLIGTLVLGSRLHDYKIEVDSQLTKLLQLNKTAAYEQGTQEGVKGERDYQNDQNRKDDAAVTRGPAGPTGPVGPQGPRGKK